MAKKKDNTALYIGIFIFAIILIYGGSHGWFKGEFSFGTLNIVDLFEREPDAECRFTLDKDEVCLWDNVTGTIRAYSPSCYIGFNYNNEGWRFAGIINETSIEFYKESRQATAIGHYEFTAICGTPSRFCRTNDVEVDVVHCPEDEPSVEYTCGWVGEQCDGTCPPTHPLCVDMWYNVLFGGYSFCACIDPDTETVHPDWKPDGQYHDDSGYPGEFPNGEPNGEPEEPVYAIGTMFQTSGKWNGDMGGLSGADSKCANAASSAGLSGNWIALLSTTTTDAIDRMPIAEYRRIDGVLIANSKADLFDGNIADTINVNEFGNTEAWSHVATGSDEDGTMRLPPEWDVDVTCTDWTSNVGSGERGINTYTTEAWISAGSSNSCGSDEHSLYCVKI